MPRFTSQAGASGRESASDVFVCVCAFVHVSPLIALSVCVCVCVCARVCACVCARKIQVVILLVLLRGGNRERVYMAVLVCCNHAFRLPFAAAVGTAGEPEDMHWVVAVDAGILAAVVAVEIVRSAAAGIESTLVSLPCCLCDQRHLTRMGEI
jgi:hypothetical protein